MHFMGYENDQQVCRTILN